MGGFCIDKSDSFLACTTRSRRNLTSFFHGIVEKKFCKRQKTGGILPGRETIKQMKNDCRKSRIQWIWEKREKEVTMAFKIFVFPHVTFSKLSWKIFQRTFVSETKQCVQWLCWKVHEVPINCAYFSVERHVQKFYPPPPNPRHDHKHDRMNRYTYYIMSTNKYYTINSYSNIIGVRRRYLRGYRYRTEWNKKKKKTV